MPVFNSYDHYCSLHRVTDTCFFFTRISQLWKIRRYYFMVWIIGPWPGYTGKRRTSARRLPSLVPPDTCVYNVHRCSRSVSKNRCILVFTYFSVSKTTGKKEIPLRFRRVRLKRSVIDAFDVFERATRIQFSKTPTSRTCANQSESPKFSSVQIIAVSNTEWRVPVNVVGIRKCVRLK